MLVKAYVVTRRAARSRAAELQDFVKAEIAPYKYPRAIEFVDRAAEDRDRQAPALPAAAGCRTRMPEHSPRHLILSLFGLYARDEANWLSVRSLIALMADLDVDAAATRSSVSRLKKRGVLEPAKSRRPGGLPAVAVRAGGAARGRRPHLVAAAGLGRGRLAGGGLLGARGRARQAARAAVAADPAGLRDRRARACGSRPARRTTRRWRRWTGPG